MAQTKGILERVFKLSEKGTTVKTEILAGLTTFVAMAYIIFVNPSILADAGIPKEAAIAATVWSAVIGSAAMGLWANFPVAVAPGMGLNAFFAYYVCGVLGLHWTVALGAVFFSGIVFLLLTVTHVRQLLIDAVPMNSSMPSSSHRHVHRLHRAPERGHRGKERRYSGRPRPCHPTRPVAGLLRPHAHGGAHGP